jgi:hypothetical protein
MIRQENRYMELKYSLTKQDYIDFNINYMSYSKSTKRMLLIQRLIGPVIFLVIPFLNSSPKSDPFSFVIFTILSILWVIFFDKIIRKDMKRRVSKVLAEGNNKGMLGEHTLILDKDGVLEITTHNESKTKWDAIEDIIESENHIFIFFSSMAGYIVPLRVFKSSNEKDIFLETLYSKIKK